MTSRQSVCNYKGSQ